MKRVVWLVRHNLAKVRIPWTAGMMCGTKVVPITSEAFTSAGFRRWLTTSKLAKAQVCHALYQLGSKCVARRYECRMSFTFRYKHPYYEISVDRVNCTNRSPVVRKFHLPLALFEVAARQKPCKFVKFLLGYTRPLSSLSCFGL